MGAMKGGKDEEKVTGPMFPRLHVNDTDKGGPRAPPRNKMALYEQFSIPSQRFNSGSSGVPRPPHNSALVPSSSSSPEVGREKAAFSPFNVPVVPPAHSSERFYSCSSDKVNINSPKRESEHDARANVSCKPPNITENYLPVSERNVFRPDELSNSKSCCGKRSVDQDDFEVPTFVQSKALHNEPDNIRAASFSTMYPGGSSLTGKRNTGVSCNSTAQLHDSHDEPLQATNTVDLMFKESGQKQVELDTAATKNTKEISIFCQSNGGKVEEPLTCTKVSSYKENLNNSGHVFKNLFGENSQLLYKAGKAENHFVSRSSNGNSHGDLNNGDCHGDSEDNGGEFRQTVDGDINDDSETSMVDSISGLDISPDDVVGVIGQKHFWKARKAIVNQQRVFAVQVFELHRLIKVQKLIAGSPQLLSDDHSYFRGPLKVSSGMPLPSERPTVVKRNDDSQKPTQTIDSQSSNPAEKACVPFDDNSGANRGLASQNSNYGLYPLNPMPLPAAPDNKVGSWCFPSPGNQWLVPVMSPSEGLVYKPYAGSYPPSGGFMAPIYGGCGPISLPPVAGDFMGVPYRGPSPHQQPGMSVFPSAPNYFSPYGYPVMNPMMPAPTVEQANMMVGPCPGHGQTEQTGEVNCNMNSRSSCNISKQKNESKLSCPRVQGTKDSEVQLSTASSPSNCHKGSERSSNQNGALPLFPTVPFPERSEQNILSQSNERHKLSQSNEHGAHVIKVVPHNRWSASESAARIFRSIQAERKHHDSQ